MTESSGQSQHLLELAYLPATDPRRQGLDAQIQLMNPADRLHWLQIVQETDLLYAQLDRAPASADLHSRLLALPDAPPIHLARWKEVLNRPLTWRPIAAAAAIAIAVAGYLLSQTAPAQPAVLGEGIAVAIATQAVEYHESASPLEVAGNDVKQVQSALAAHPLPFPVMVLEPRVKLDLRGGGLCRIDGTPAVFTRWEAAGANYTVYQFDGKQAGIPASFLRTTEIPRQLWHDNKHYRVVIWPGNGGLCTWALVMDSDAATDAFSIGY